MKSSGKVFMKLVVLSISLLGITGAKASGSTPITVANAVRVRQIAKWGRGWVNQVAWSPDGATLALGGAQGVWIYSRDALKTGVDTAHPKLLDEQYRPVTALAFSPDSTLLAAGSADHSIVLWTPVTGRQKATLIPDNGWQIDGLAFSPDGKTLAASGSVLKEITLWDVQTAKVRTTLVSSQQGYTSLAYSPDGKYLAAGTDIADQQTVVWDAAAGTVAFTLDGVAGGVHHLSFSPNGQWLAVADRSQVRLFDAVTGQQNGSIKDAQQDNSFAFTPDSKMLITACTDGNIRLWNVTDTAKPIATLSGHLGGVGAVAPSPDGALLASVSPYDTLRLWTLADDKPLAAAPDFAAPINEMVLAPDSTTAITGDAAGFVNYLDVPTGKTIKTLHRQTGSVDTIALSPDGKTLAAGSSGSGDYRVSLWEVASGKSLPGTGTVVNPAEHVRFSPNGKLLAVGSDGPLNVVDVTTGKQVGSIPDSEGALGFSPDSKTLVVGTETNINAYDTATFTLKEAVDKPHGLASSVVYNPAGTMIAISYIDPDIHLLDPETMKEIKTLKNDQDGDPVSLAFSPDGSILASGMSTREIVLWDVQGGKALARLTGFHQRVLSLVFTPDGPRLISTGGEGTIRVWGVGS